MVASTASAFSRMIPRAWRETRFAGHERSPTIDTAGDNFGGPEGEIPLQHLVDIAEDRVDIGGGQQATKAWHAIPALRYDSYGRTGIGIDLQ